MSFLCWIGIHKWSRKWSKMIVTKILSNGECYGGYEFYKKCRRKGCEVRR